MRQRRRRRLSWPRAGVKSAHGLLAREIGALNAWRQKASARNREAGHHHLAYMRGGENNMRPEIGAGSNVCLKKA